MSNKTSPLRRRWLQGALGAALVAVGLSGLSGLLPSAATAQPADRPGDSHETMHVMMDAMHGDGTAERVHEAEGGEEMMDQCAAMMSMMGDMNMSRGGMMERMMNGGGMSGMGGMMGSR